MIGKLRAHNIRRLALTPIKKWNSRQGTSLQRLSAATHRGPAKQQPLDHAPLIPRSTEGVLALSKAAMLIFVIVFLAWHWIYVSQWLATLTHAEAFGVKLDRKVLDDLTRGVNQGIEEARKQEIGEKNDYPGFFGFDKTASDAMYARAVRIAPTLNGAEVLWVDDHPEHNTLEEDILRDLGIHFTNSTNSDEALALLKSNQYDLIISSVSRRNEPHAHLAICRIHYFELPADGSSGSLTLDQFNAKVNDDAPGGFVFMDTVRQRLGGNSPQMIFFSASTGDRVASQCARADTTRVDILFSNVLNVLAETRWKQLEASNQKGAEH